MEKSSQPVTSLETKQQVARMEHLKNQKVEKLFFFFENEIKILKKKGDWYVPRDRRLLKNYDIVRSKI